MRGYLLLLIAGIALLACEPQPKPPPLDREKLKAVLWDLQVARAAVYGHSQPQQDSMMNVYREQILEIHHISRKELEASLEALEEDQQLLLDLLNELEREKMEPND